MINKMKSLTGKALAIAVSAVALALFLSAPAQATLQVDVNVWDGINSNHFVVVDNGVGDTDLATGIISLGPAVTIIPGYVASSSIHTSSNVSGYGNLTSSSLNVAYTGAGTARAIVAVSDTDFGPTAYSSYVTGGGVFKNTIGSTMLMSYYDDPLNTQGANSLAPGGFLTPGALVASFSHLITHPSESFSDNLYDIPVTDLGKYSMTLLFDFTLASGGELISRGQVMEKSPVPLPAAVWFLAPGLMGLIGIRRRITK